MENFEDFKIDLNKEQLKGIIGEAQLKELENIFAERYDEIIIRRCSAVGK